MNRKRVFENYSFAEYFGVYCTRKGISKSFVAQLLEIASSTCRSKFRNDCFSYAEICYLDFYFDDLNYLDNMRNYLVLRVKHDVSLIK